jgi:hypothetical protein
MKIKRVAYGEALLTVEFDFVATSARVFQHHLRHIRRIGH